MEQRPQARQAALNRVCSAATQLLSLFVAKNLNIHAGLQRKISGQLPNLGSVRAGDIARCSTSLCEIAHDLPVKVGYCVQAPTLASVVANTI
jgi:hypothetical protein